MLASLSQDSASYLLTWSNRIYVSGALLTLASAAMVLYEKRSANHGHRLRWGLATEIVVIVAAFVSLCGTVGAITFGNMVSHLKDLDLEAYKASAGIQIAQANKDAANANYAAGLANNNAAGATKEAARANATAEKAVLDKAAILNQNLKLQQQVDQERDKRLQIEQRLAPRSLTRGAQNLIISALNRAGLREIDIIIPPGDPEADLLARQFAWAVEQSSCKPYYYKPLSASLQGMLIKYDPQDKTAAQVSNELASALKAAGLDIAALVPDLPELGKELGVYTSGDGAKGSAKIRVFIGSK